MERDTNPRFREPVPIALHTGTSSAERVSSASPQRTRVASGARTKASSLLAARERPIHLGSSRGGRHAAARPALSHSAGSSNLRIAASIAAFACSNSKSRSAGFSGRRSKSNNISLDCSAAKVGLRPNWLSLCCTARSTGRSRGDRGLGLFFGLALFV